MSQNEIETAVAWLEERFLEPGVEFDTRKQANAIAVLCFRNTKLEDFHAEGYISDNEMKNLSIEACARIEYLMLTGRFDDLLAADIFSFAFESPYKVHVEKDLRKPMWRALRKEAVSKLETVQFVKANEALVYKAELLRNWGFYARYYNEDIKFDGQVLSGDPNAIAVGHQWAKPLE